ncbi:penicillin-binding protein 1C [Alcaligenaceae bacterium]|nr:penicillin-binding protein 1C [Alcaligenaceae bacterium]
MSKAVANLAVRSCVALALAIGCAGPSLAVPSFKQVKSDYAASDVLVQDRTGQLLERVRLDFYARRGDWIALDDVSVALQRAVIMSEDRRFYSHGGVDWQAMASAAWDNLINTQRRGASTLTMQLLGLIDPAYSRGPGGRSVSDKIDQAFEARRLEDDWSKPQILEAYLNLVAFRGELEGVDALSHVLFQKDPSGLNMREAALAAVLLRGPNAPEPVLVRRTCALLGEMGQPAECTGLRDFVYLVLQRKSAPWAGRRGLAPHFARLALQGLDKSALRPGQVVSTSLNAELQRFALHSVALRLRELDMANVRDAAVVVLDNSSGEVLAYVGSSGGLSGATYVDHARSRRQAGSTLKPFLYAQGLEQQRLTAVSLLDDGPLNLSTGSGLYIPQNYDEQFSGWVSVRTALASSLNIPAVRVLTMVTPDAFARLLVRLGLPLEETGDFYGYSLALGSADVSLLTLTNAYRALANLGTVSKSRLLPVAEGRADQAQTVMASGAAWIVGDILSDRQARARTFGLDSPLSTPFWTAVKTGTSKDMRDNWCMGWSDRYTVGVWVGNSGGASMREVSGVSGAGPIWHDIMTYLHRGQGSRQPAMPASVSTGQVSFEQGIEPTRQDVFLGDTQVQRVELARSQLTTNQGTPRITQPADQAILALDPDIPWKHQRVWLHAANIAAGMAKNVSWRVDGHIIGSGARIAWAPEPGKKRIELLDGQGRVVDTVMLEVRDVRIR